MQEKKKYFNKLCLFQDELFGPILPILNVNSADEVTLYVPLIKGLKIEIVLSAPSEIQSSENLSKKKVILVKDGFSDCFILRRLS